MSASTATSSLPELSTYSYNLDDWLDLTGQRTPEEDSERWVSYSIPDLYPDWQERAHCLGVGVEYYFGDDDGQPTMSIKQVRRAAKLCEVCRVYVECLTHALTVREEYGVWAGTSGRVRRKIFKMLDNDLTTVDEVVGRFRDGQGDIYRYAREDQAPHPKVTRQGVLRRLPSRDRTLAEGQDRLRAVDRWEVAL